jgi:hypothetical protein
MSDEMFLSLVVVVLVGVLLTVLLVARASRRRRSLRHRFGPEYDRVLAEAGSRRATRAELVNRLRRHEQLDLRALEPDGYSRYLSSWTETQGRFVEDPRSAVVDAGHLLVALMAERGYPTDGSQRQRLADLSVEHAAILDRYRLAHATTGRLNAPTEELRQAMLDYRALFMELLGEAPESATLPGDHVQASKEDALA